jgi:competence protein ComGC
MKSIKKMKRNRGKLFFDEKNNRISTTGFTLIEIMVVVVIIILLTSVVIVAVDTARVRTREAIIMTSLEQIQAIAETNYNPVNGYKELYKMREENHPRIEEIRSKIIDMAGPAYNFNIFFPEDVSGVSGYDEYCVWIKLLQQPKSGPERNFCVDSTGTAKVVEYQWGVIGYNCREDAIPQNCEYK